MLSFLIFAVLLSASFIGTSVVVNKVVKNNTARVLLTVSIGLMLAIGIVILLVAGCSGLGNIH